MPGSAGSRRKGGTKRSIIPCHSERSDSGVEESVLFWGRLFGGNGSFDSGQADACPPFLSGMLATGKHSIRRFAALCNTLKGRLWREQAPALRHEKQYGR